ncbi:MAG: choice-of-anchor J domain-containing protein [Bacteroidales bacterium]|nr:choice-of-anchor J domain-containing protein [Bacteroidales bacterium]
MRKVYFLLSFLLMIGVLNAQTKRTSFDVNRSIKAPKLSVHSATGVKLPDTDTLDNTLPTDTLTAYTLQGQWGYFPGHNGYQMNKYAEKFTNSIPGEINGIFVAVAVAYAANPNASVTFKVYSGSGNTPGAELGSKTVQIGSFTTQQYNEVVFDNPIPVTGNFFVGYEITYSNPVDTFSTFIAKFGNPNRTVNTAYCMYNNSWYAVDNLFQGGPKTAHAILVRFAANTSSNPTASVAPTSYTFTNVPVNTTATSTNFTLTNAGGGTLTASAVNGLSGTPFTCSLNPSTVNLATGQSVNFTFSYNPTAAGTHTATATIVTNGGNVNITLNGTAVSCSAITTFPWVESFEGTAFPPQCWNNLDVDGDGKKWEVRDESQGWDAYDGTKCAVSASWVQQPLTPNNYLITPQLSIPNNNMVLKFYAAPQDPQWPSEYFGVEVSTTGIQPANFSSIFTYTLQAADSVWKEFTLPLANYSGQNIYIAFRHYNCTDWFYMKLDKVQVMQATDIDFSQINGPVFVYPNPASSKLMVANEKASRIEIYNLKGQLVAEYSNTTEANISEIAQGTYMVKIVTNNHVFTQKINIVR